MLWARGRSRTSALLRPVMLCALCRHLHMLLDIPLEAPGLARMKMETRTVIDPVTGPCLLATLRGTTSPLGHLGILNFKGRKSEKVKEGPA